jgi:dTDP-glucose 4,6-dehydratase
MKVVITGGAGFIGSNLVHLLRSERPDWHLTVLDNLTYAGNLENIAELLKSENVSLAKIDITDADAVEDLFAAGNFDLVFHLAAESHVDRSIHSASEFVKTNVVGTQNLLNSARSHAVGRFVHVSTDEVYGSLGPEGRFLETTPLQPSSPYSASKAGSDLMALAAHHTHGYNVVVTRCTNNYGPFQFPEKLIPLFITNALGDQHLPLYGDGSNVRSWIHVSDHCEALLKVAEQGRAGEVYNIGGEQEAELSNLEVTKIVLQVLGKPESLIKKVSDRLGHDFRYAVDCSKIRKELGWEPRIKFQQGIVDTVQWYVSNQNWWQRIKSGEYLEYYQRQYQSLN